uniref:Basic proline-rich protein-like n=1 Tax=Callorhinus ursinus TaxID=34884 RepID=A0A3Q7ND65_CALUR|nr:basic proline-rich protein-like [Callorhinus ursinus]
MKQRQDTQGSTLASVSQPDTGLTPASQHLGILTSSPLEEETEAQEALARLGWCSGLQELVVCPQDGDPWSLAAGRQLPPLQDRRREQEGGIQEGAGEGSRGEGGGTDDAGIPTEFPRREDCGGGVGSPELREVSELPGGREGESLAGPSLGLPGAAEPGGRSPGQTPAPRAPAPPQPRRRGPGPCSGESTFCRGCREQRDLPPAPPEERRGRSLIPRLGASVSGNREHLGAHRTPPPPPTFQTGTSPAKGCGLAKVAGKARPRRPAPPPSPVPGPRRVALTMLAPLRAPRALRFPRKDSNPPSSHRLRARLRGGSERPGGGRRGKRGRAGGRAGAGAGLGPAGPPDVGGGDGGQPPPSASQPEPRPDSPRQPRRGPPRRPAPEPPELRCRLRPAPPPPPARRADPRRVGSPPGAADVPGGRPARPAPPPPGLARPSRFPELGSSRRGAFRPSPPRSSPPPLR